MTTGNNRESAIDLDQVGPKLCFNTPEHYTNYSSSGYPHTVRNHNLEGIVLQKELDSHMGQATAHQLPESCKKLIMSSKGIDKEPMNKRKDVTLPLEVQQSSNSFAVHSSTLNKKESKEEEMGCPYRSNSFSLNLQLRVHCKGQKGKSSTHWNHPGNPHAAHKLWGTDVLGQHELPDQMQRFLGQV